MTVTVPDIAYTVAVINSAYNLYLFSLNLTIKNAACHATQKSQIFPESPSHRKFGNQEMFLHLVVHSQLK